jgi:ArsR family transcriptional regulator
MRERRRTAVGGRPPRRPDAPPNGSTLRRQRDGGLTGKEFVTIARALADPTRVTILRTIAASAPLCCGAIGRVVPVRPATVSHHLRVLAEAGLVDMQRDGQFINVGINAGRLAQFRDAIGAIAVGDERPAIVAVRPAAAGRQP